MFIGLNFINCSKLTSNRQAHESYHLNIQGNMFHIVTILNVLCFDILQAASFL